ncbi:thioredoxin-like 1-1, chloroplastic isoform X1 [Solanum lycopersicum]|uniref:thioredoxin-like 1-1, chloroplastic isoform X1 n=1 Tax=Solanum lycopersicum TaxID=4081 RepID=UPI0037486BA1
MASSLSSGFSVSGPCFNSRAKGSAHHCYSNGNLQLKDLTSREFLGKSLNVSDHIQALEEICVESGQGWWEKTLKPNMVEINSAQQHVDSLLKAGDRLVVIDFYSPDCGGCKTSHPKVWYQNDQGISFLQLS